MLDNLEEENSYFKNVVKDAIKELKQEGRSFVFFQEQVDAIKEVLGDNLDVKFDGTIFNLKIKEFDKKKKK